MKMKLHVARIAAIASLMVLAGCGGGASSLLGLPSGGGSCSPHTISLAFPSTTGFSVSGQLTSATQCFSSGSVTTYASTSPLLGSPFVSNDSSAQVLLYLGITMSTTEYASGLPSLTVTVPAGTTTANRKFYVAYNYGGGSSFSWSATALGPATASGSTVSFGSGSLATTFHANDETELAVYSVAGP